ncbi:MAG: hypothetical protein K2J31_02160 [Alistipes sp.]|nr:hypothetical protein [Alistipes sp.]MDE6861533.1 hypothetical protein [Alistipes sp.]
MSIQLPLGGHSFSAESLTGDMLSGNMPVEAVLPTAQTLLIPQEEFSASLIDAYLAAAGMACRPEQCCVSTPQDNGIVAVMAIDKATHEILHKAFGDRLYYTTPLLAPCALQCGAALQRIQTLLFARVYVDGELRFAEVMPSQNEADLRYHLSKLDSVYHIYNMEARLLGSAAGLIEVCKPIFKHLTCE